ncbi:MAG: MBL fold metallo-hydrolase [Candidatus Altiarchaeota archaeon]
MKLTWLGHASFRLEDKAVVYFDPFKVEGKHDADIILVSHGHYDHCDTGSISRLLKDDTIVLCPESCISKIEGNVTAMNAGEAVTVKDVRVEAHPAYNTNKPNHPEGEGLGFVVESSGRRVYHAGDTDLIPEMGELGRVDAALLPVGGTYTMDWKEATEAVKLIKPAIAVPMHYGDIVGSAKDALKFADMVRAETKTKAAILKQGESTEL